MRPAPVSLAGASFLSIFQVGAIESAHPFASSTRARNVNCSPGRMSFREGRTSRRAGGPVSLQRFGGGLGFSGAAGAFGSGGGAEAAGWGGGSPCRWIKRNDRVRRTLAVQFCPSITNWYWPVSSKLMALSVALMVVMTVAWRGSLAAVLQTLCQPRWPPEWLRRRRPGNCSQQCVVEYVGPAPADRQLAADLLDCHRAARSAAAARFGAAGLAPVADVPLRCAWPLPTSAPTGSAARRAPSSHRARALSAGRTALGGPRRRQA